MRSFSTYGMAGIGIAAAVGFVFSLTVLNSSNLPGTPGGDTSELTQRQAETQPAGPSSFFFEQEKGEDSASELAKRNAPAGADSPQQEMMLLEEEATELRPVLSSLVAVNGTSGEVIGEVKQGSQFTVGKPVFIQAHFINPNETEILDHTLVLSIARNGTGGATASTNFEQAANFRGDIGANGNVELEMYWNPNREGEHTLFLFSLTPNELSDINAAEQTLSIQIKAIRG